MGQSLVKNYIHIVFSTKYREPLIHPPIESELHSYIAGICNNLECYPVVIGGYTDHIHILCMLSKKIAFAGRKLRLLLAHASLMKLVEKIKSNSSKWIKTKDEHLKNFYWQDGYGGFSVNPGDLDRLKDYITRQHEHHLGKNFKKEYLKLLKDYSTVFDERYIWR